MKFVYQAENLLDAHLVKGALESHGIPAFVAGEHLTGGIGQLPTMGLLAVMVADDDVASAESLVAELRRAAPASIRDDEDEAALEGDWVPKPA